MKHNFLILHHTKDILVIQTFGANDTSSDFARLSNSPSYGDFNLGLHVGETPSKVLKNRAKLLAQLNQYLARNQPQDIYATSCIKSIHWLNQIHSNRVVDIDTLNPNCSLPIIPPDADAQITLKPHQALAVMTADCVPIALYHPQSKQIATIHAGWKGLANGVIGQTLAQLTKTPANQAYEFKWQAWIGACICQNCYEVSLDVVEKLLHGCHLVAPSIDLNELRRHAVKPHATDPNKAWLDLVAITTAQLRHLNVEIQKADNPEGLQTITNNNNCETNNALACSYGNRQFYSYRRMTHQKQPNTGRMALLIARLR